jgi:hypothetical protein
VGRSRLAAFRTITGAFAIEPASARPCPTLSCHMMIGLAQACMTLIFRSCECAGAVEITTDAESDATHLSANTNQVTHGDHQVGHGLTPTDVVKHPSRGCRLQLGRLPADWEFGIPCSDC